jgi:hypothetical protein
VLLVKVRESEASLEQSSPTKRVVLFLSVIV